MNGLVITYLENLGKYHSVFRQLVWLVFRGFKLMEINVATAVFQVGGCRQLEVIAVQS